MLRAPVCKGKGERCNPLVHGRGKEAGSVREEIRSNLGAWPEVIGNEAVLELEHLRRGSSC